MRLYLIQNLIIRFINQKKICAPNVSTLCRQADGERKEQLQEAYTKHIKNKESVRELKAKDKIEVDPATTIVAIYDLEKVLTIPQSERDLSLQAEVSHI